MPPFISIGCECGGPEAKFVAERKTQLFGTLSTSVSSTHCLAVDEYALVLRVDGGHMRYGPEGLHNLRFAKAKRYITVDIQVPEQVWRELSTPALDEYLVAKVEDALQVCVARLKKDGHPVGERALMEEVRQASAEFLLQAQSQLPTSGA